MTRSEFLSLAQKTLILDGATGSNLMKAGLPRGVCVEKWVLEHPDTILNLQRAYVQAGSQVLYAPTFTASGPYLAEYGLDGELETINSALVALSKEAANGKAYVAGDMTTVGKPDVPYEKLLEVYTRQATALRDAGVDLYVIETMMGLEETMAALEACSMTADLPVMCSFSVTSDGMLYFGGSIYDAAPQLEGFGASTVGINCSCGPDQMIAVVENLSKVLTVPVIAKPNAGMPVIDDLGNAVYSMAPDEFGVQMKKLRQVGASVLGGCCGTDPSYIAALHNTL